jgi:hypothetical protein
VSRTEDRQALVNKAAALSELIARRAVCPIASFEPHAGQQRIIDSAAPITIAMTGNRWGKTEAMVAELICAGIGYRPYQVPDFKLNIAPDGTVSFPDRSQVPMEAWVRRVDGLPINIPSKVVVVSGLSLERGIGEIIQEKFTALWPKDVKYKTHLGPLGVWKKLQLPNGSEFYFGSATQALMSWEGFAADAVVADEPLPKRVFIALRRGLIDRKGQFKWSMTPLGDAAMAWVQADLLTEERNDVEIIRGTSWDNPYLDREALRSFLEDPSMSEDERRARETGEIAALGRRIVTTFSDKCIIPPTTIPPDVPRLLVVDPHHARPAFMVWIAVMDDGEELIAYREWPETDFEKMRTPAMSLHDLAGMIKEREGKENVQWRICDPAFGVQHAKVHGDQFRSFVEEMSDYGLDFDARVDNDVERGIARLRDAFKISNVTDKPRLSVMRHLKNCIRGLQFWSYQEGRDGQLKVSEQFKDPVDCLRYATMYELPYHIGEELCYLEEE